MDIDLSVQLYTLRNELDKDFIGTLEKVSQIGYKGVEFAGYGGITASQMKYHLNRLGLEVTGSHVPLNELSEDLDNVIEYNMEIDNKYIVCPYAEYKSKQDFKDMAVLLNKVGEKCSTKGLKLCYHNHAHEFKIYDGEYGLDILYKETDSELVKSEFDTYWISYAGIDPVSYIKSHKDRCELVHIKDMAADDKTYTEIGNGIMDIKKIINASNESGAKWLIVEQDECKKPPLESIKISYNYLKNMRG